MISLSIAVALLVAVAAYLLHRNTTLLKSGADAKAQCAILSESSSRLEAEAKALAAERDTLRERVTALTAQCASLTSRMEAEKEAAKEHDSRLESHFKNLAADIMRANSAEMRDNAERRLGEIINPLRAGIDDFKKLVNDTYQAEARERYSLNDRIRELVEANQSISRQARELSEALRGDSKVQGDWGEMLLESILEKSGLEKGLVYEVQATRHEDGSVIRDSEGKALRPDVVVKYPDERVVVIDSKVSLSAYVDYANADDAELREAAAGRHVRSVAAHVDELAAKSYQDFIGKAKLDFVMMFIPSEPAYIAAMRLSPTLWQKAYDKQVLIVSPTQLVAALRLISMLWTRDRQTRNAIAIAEEAAKMLGKFADFTKDMERIDRSLESTRKAYDDAMNKLSQGTGNLVNRARKLEEMGVKTAKKLSASLTVTED